NSAFDGALTQGALQELSRQAGIVTTKERESVHEVKLKTGTTYVVDLESKAFDTFLRLYDAQGKKLDENDDISENNLNSRLTFLPPADGIYRLVVSAFDQREGP